MSFKSPDQVELPLATSPRKPQIYIKMEFFPAYIPPLLGMDILDREVLIADTVTNHLTKRSACKATHGTYF